jgi:hypothetical protein
VRLVSLALGAGLALRGAAAAARAARRRACTTALPAARHRPAAEAAGRHATRELRHAAGRRGAPEHARGAPPVAADLTRALKGRPVTGREVEPELAPALKEALNDWAETCGKAAAHRGQHRQPDFLVIGRAGRDADAAARWMDEVKRPARPGRAAVV